MKWMCVVVAAVTLIVGFGFFVNRQEDRETACEDAGGYWLRGAGGSACYDVERIEP